MDPSPYPTNILMDIELTYYEERQQCGIKVPNYSDLLQNIILLPIPSPPLLFMNVRVHSAHDTPC